MSSEGSGKAHLGLLIVKYQNHLCWLRLKSSLAINCYKLEPLETYSEKVKSVDLDKINHSAASQLGIQCLLCQMFKLTWLNNSHLMVRSNTFLINQNFNGSNMLGTIK